MRFQFFTDLNFFAKLNKWKSNDSIHVYVCKVNGLFQGVDRKAF